MKRHSPDIKDPKGKWSCPDKEFAKDFPHLAEHLCDGTWEDGSARDVGSLTVRLGGGTVFVSLTDYDLSASLFCNGDSIWGAFRDLDDALGQPHPQWRRWKKGKGR